MTSNRYSTALGLYVCLSFLLLFSVALPARAAIQGEYFVWTGASPPADPWNVENRRGTRIDGNVDFNWADPGIGGIGADMFSVRWRGQVYIPTAGDWTFYTLTDDGARLYLNAEQIIAQWVDQGNTEVSATRTLSAGWHDIIMEYYENGGGAVAQLSYAGPGVGKQIIPTGALRADYGKGLLAEYHHGRWDGTHTLVISRNDGTVNFNWNTGTPQPEVNVDNFCARWRGKVEAPATGNYTFYVTSDDGQDLWLNGVQVINNIGAAQGPTPFSATVALTAGQKYFIEVRFNEFTGGAACWMEWEGPGIARQVVPERYLHAILNEAPGNISLSNAAVGSNLPAGTAVGTFSTTDIDNSTGASPAQTHTYALVSGTGDTHNGLFSISGAGLRTVNANMAPGTYSIRVRTTDNGQIPNNLTYEKTFTITVNDTTPPVAVCRNVTVNLSAPTINPLAIDNGSTDNVGITARTINGAASVTYTCANLGANTATLRVADAAGNFSECTATVTVVDNIAPVAACKNITVNLSAPTIPASVVDNGSSDNCGIASMLIDGGANKTFSCANIGPNTVTFRVTDAAGNFNECMSTVTVVDNIAPVAACKNITVNLSAPTISASALDNGSSDNCGIASMLIDGAASKTFTCANIGPNTVTLRVLDAAGNFNECTATVTVVDNVAPVAVCQNVTVNLSAPTLAAATVGGASTDNCGIASTLIDGVASKTYTCANLGPNTVTLRVTDAAGNFNECTATVTVVDNIAPDAVCKNLSVNLGAPTLAASAFDNGSTDNCAITTMLVDGAPSRTFTCADMPTKTVTFRVLDARGNFDDCTATVTVTDNILPVAVCKNLTVNLSAPTIAASAIDNGSSDNCAITTRLINGSASRTFSCANLGANVVTLRVMDAAGNFATCAASVTVVDDIPPVAVCRNVTVNLASPTLTAASVNNGSTDNCGIASVLIDGAASRTFTCANLGPNTVTLRVTDAAGNFNECQATVTVVDNIAPVAVCKDATVYLSSPTLLPGDIDGGSSDNCAIAAMQVNGAPEQTFTTGDVGVQSVTLRVSDAAGLFDECTAQVTVVDDLAVEGEGEPPVEGEGEPPAGLEVTADETSFTRAEGGSVTFAVTVSNAQGSLHYQWYRVMEDDSLEVIPAQNDTVLVLSNLTAGSAGEYQCEVYDDVLEETAMSPVFTLVVITGVPAAGVAGLALVAVLTALAGIRRTRKR